jgi:hypothetical protein
MPDAASARRDAGPSPVKVTLTDPRRDAEIYRGGTGTFTTTGTITAWDAQDGKRWLLKGFLVTLIVSDTLAAADEVLFYFADSGDSNRVVAPIGAAVANAAAGTIITRDVPDLGSGRLASSKTANLIIKADIDITTGDVKVVWECWGDEVAR